MDTLLKEFSSNRKDNLSCSSPFARLRVCSPRWDDLLKAAHAFLSLPNHCISVYVVLEKAR